MTTIQRGIFFKATIGFVRFYVRIFLCVLLVKLATELVLPNIWMAGIAGLAMLALLITGAVVAAGCVSDRTQLT